MPNLTTRITEAWTSGVTGEAHAFDKTVTIGNVNRYAKFEYIARTSANRTMIEVDNALSTGTMNAGKIPLADFKYLRIKNYSSSNACEITIANNASGTIHSYTKKLLPLEVFELSNLAMDAHDATPLANGDTNENAQSFYAKGVGANVNLEMIVAYA